MPVASDIEENKGMAPAPLRRRRLPFFGRCAVVVATGFGLGYVPFVPGTLASVLLSLPLALGVTAYHGHLWTQVAIVAALALLAVPICDAARELLGEKGARRIVADKYLLLPLCYVGQMPVWEMAVRGGVDGRTALVFFLFVLVLSRFCTLLRPSPVRQLGAVKGGLGLVLDDLAASAYAWVLAWGLGDWVVPRLVALL